MRSRTGRGSRSRSRNAPASSAPTTSWPTKWPSANVAGLPMSWSSAASRTTGRAAGAASTARSVWSQRSSPGDLVLGDPALGGQIGRDRARAGPCRSSAAARPTGRARRAACRARRRSARRTGDGRGRPAPGSRPASPARCRTRASRPGGRRGSSAGRPPRTASAASPTARRPARLARPRGHRTDRGTPARRPAPTPHAIALTVKSRRARSSSMVSPNSTRCGRRKSA